MSCFNFQEVLIFFWFSPLDIDYMMFYLRHGITTSNIPKVREWLNLDLSKSCKGNNYATVFTLYALVMILRQIRASPDANGRSLQEETNKEVTPGANDQAQEAMKIDDDVTTKATDGQPDPKANLSEKRKALFEPLEPLDGRRTPAEMLLPPPDFEPASYPKGWLVGKKRKLVNVDVVESMRRIAIQEMNRKDREINGLNEQLEEDSRVLEHLQKQLAEERKKRVEMEKENSMLQDQVSMLMNMLEQNETFDDDEGEVPPPDP